METPQPASETPAKKNRTPLIIAVVAAVLLCGCLVVAVAGYYAFITIRNTQTEVQPVEDFTPVIPDATFEVPEIEAGVGEPPTGGLGNDILKNDTWQYVGAAAVGQGCDRPIGAISTIEVLQEPDANGVWVEEWTVVCRSGDSYAFEVEYVLDDTGATFNIKSLP